MYVYSRVATEYTNVTDRRTDGQTYGHCTTHRPRLCITSRGKNWYGNTTYDHCTPAPIKRLCGLAYGISIFTAISP